MLFVSVILAWLNLFTAQPETVEREVDLPPIYFRWDKSSHDATYAQNRKAANSIIDMIKLIGPQKIEYAQLVAYASPEGVREHNLKLSRARAYEIRWLIRQKAPSISSKIRIRAGGEGWVLLRARVQADKRISDKSREKILRVLDDQSISDDTRKWRLANRLGSDSRVGELWPYLLKTHYPKLRACTVTIRFKAVPGTPLAEIGRPVEGSPASETATTDSGATVAATPAGETAAAAAETAQTDSTAATETQSAGETAAATAHTTDSAQTTEATTTGSSSSNIDAAETTPADSSAAADSTAAAEAQPSEDRAALGTVRGGTESEANGGVERSETSEEGSAAAAEGKSTPRIPVLAVSTNLIYDLTYIPGYGLTTIPSFSLEYYPAAGRWTFGADVEWPMWQHFDTHRFMQINNITLWGRRYFKPKDESFKGLYLLGSLGANRYGVGWNERGWKGEGIHASAGIGWKKYLGRSRFFFDTGLALGVFWSRYDPYVYSNEATGWYYYDYTGKPADFTERSKRLLWFGPTRAYVSIGYDLFTRRRK
ncbi:MAG: DUF3575 domain-containing protein [Bacteroidales bacterium]|nr:DUF3575 domain-containing protein [Bacteroidales bacterium]